MVVNEALLIIQKPLWEHDGYSFRWHLWDLHNWASKTRRGVGVHIPTPYHSRPSEEGVVWQVQSAEDGWLNCPCSCHPRNNWLP